MSAKVLVVDDEESILKGIKLNLGRKFDLTLANGPEEAQQLVRNEGPFAVVVSDMRMPVMDGASLMRKIKEEHPATLCILLTGHADFEFGGSQALQSGLLFKILNKPCSPEKLGNAIQAAFDQLSGKESEDEAPPPNVI
jgi:DNA-binding NtrC family response regulator